MGSSKMKAFVAVYLFSLIYACSGQAASGEAKADGCCDSIRLDSGGMADFNQPESMGIYKKMENLMVGGRPVYAQAGGAGRYLSWVPETGIWMVGNEIGVDYGFLLNREAGMCPENLVRDWEYWDSWFNEWDTDWSLAAECESGGGGGYPGTTQKPTIPPNSDSCLSGSVCNNCNIWSMHNDVLYCCSVDCNSGWISTGEENGVVNCVCGH